MATKKAQVDIEVTGIKSIEDIELELKAVNDELRTLDVNSEAFANMSKEAQALNGQLQDVNKQLEYISPAEQADGFLKMGEGIFGAVAAVEGLSAAFGVNDEAMEETIKKLVGMVAAMDGIRKVAEALQRENLTKLARGFQSVGEVAKTGFNGVKSAINTASTSMNNLVGATKTGAKIMKISLISIGITAIIVAIGAIIANWDKLVGMFKGGGDTAKEKFEALTEELQTINEELNIMNGYLQKNYDNIQKISQLDIGDLIDNDKLIFARKNIVDIELELSTYRKGSLQYLEAEQKLIDAKISQQELLLDLAKIQTEEATRQNIIDLEGLSAIQKINELKQQRLDVENELYKANIGLKIELEAISKLREDDASNKKIKKQQENVDAAKAAVEGLATQYENLSKQIESIANIDVNLFTDEQVKQVEKFLNELKNASKDADDAIAAYKLKVAKEADAIFLEEAKKNLKAMQDYQEKNPVKIDIEVNQQSIKNIVIKPTVDPTNWEQFVMNAKMDIGEIKFNTEQWGGQISEFSNTYLAPLAQEFSNIISVNADLYAAEQEQIIALAELKIEANQEVIDAEMEKQEELQDLINDNNDEILDYEDLLKDANAERYAEIQAKIEEEKAANATLQLQKDESVKKELAATKAKEKAEYEQALAAWNIKKNDMQAAQVQAAINGALAIINALGNPFPLNIIMPILIGIATAVQLSAISKNISALDKTKPIPPKAAKGMLVGPSHSGGGIPIEAEGGEFIVNKRATAEYLPLIEAINNSGNRPKYADGGQVTVPQTVDAKTGIDYDQLAQAIARSVQPVVSVVEITNKQNQVKVIEQNAGI